MKVKEAWVKSLIIDETAKVLREYIDEAEGEDKEPEVGGADTDNTDTEPEDRRDDIAPKKGAEKNDAADGGEPPKPDKEKDVGEPPVADKNKDEPKPPTDGPAPEDNADAEGEEVPAGDDPADNELSGDVEDPDSLEKQAQADDEEPKGSDISQDIAQKTIQSITMDQDVKGFMGFTVIEIQFEDIPHPLRILVGQSGMVKFHFRGSLHNTLGDEGNKGEEGVREDTWRSSLRR